MPHFFLKLIAPRPTFATDMNDAEKKMMQEHFLYWKVRQDKGDVLVFGPVMDPAGPYGMALSRRMTKRVPARLRQAIRP